MGKKTIRPGYRYGGRKGKRYRLRENDELLVVRTANRQAPTRGVLAPKSLDSLADYQPLFAYQAAGVFVLQSTATRGRRSARDKARKVLKGDKSVEFAGRVLSDPGSNLPVLYTENLFVKFEDGVGVRKARKRIKDAGLTIKRPLEYARGCYFVAAPDGCGRKVFEIADALLADSDVELCHPELVRPRSLRAASPQQWHLDKRTIDGRVINQHAHVVSAWELGEGEGVTIAVVDDGVDVDHQDFGGAGKVMHPRDVTRGVDDARPFFGNDNHGTACAGVACASGLHGASGVAPRATLMPVRLMSALGSQDEADAFFWAAQHGADVISCSWGPTDGKWWDPDDPQHDVVVPLPDSTRLAIDWAVNNGRNGKGCLVTWAAGNGNESVDNDGYASYERVVAVAACSDRGKKSVYSDVGDANWCSFPSNDFTHPQLTPGIWTTDRSGTAGYNPGAPNAPGDDAGQYTEEFGGTSSACPGAAGVAALVLGRNPELRWDEVRDVLKRSCDRIDTANGDYDADGHSKLYGFGRLNARKAVELAVPPAPDYTALHRAAQDVVIQDDRTSRLRVAVGDTKKLKDLRIHVDLEHTWIGDLVVKVKPPGTPAITLHDRAGRSADNIHKIYDTVSTPALADLLGTSPQGTWALSVTDRGTGDTGKILAFGVECML